MAGLGGEFLPQVRLLPCLRDLQLVSALGALRSGRDKEQNFGVRRLLQRRGMTNCLLCDCPDLQICGAGLICRKDSGSI